MTHLIADEINSDANSINVYRNSYDVLKAWLEILFKLFFSLPVFFRQTFSLLRIIQ